MADLFACRCCFRAVFDAGSVDALILAGSLLFGRTAESFRQIKGCEDKAFLYRVIKGFGVCHQFFFKKCISSSISDAGINGQSASAHFVDAPRNKGIFSGDNGLPAATAAV